MRAVVPGLSPPPADDRHRDVWLAEGFPPIQPGQLAPDRHQPVSSLLRQLDAELPSGVALQVQVPARLLGVDGQVPRLSRPVDWQVQPSPEEAPAPQEAALPRLVIRHDPAHADAARWLRAVALAWQPERAADVAPTDVPVTAVTPAHLTGTVATGPRRLLALAMNRPRHRKLKDRFWPSMSRNWGSRRPGASSSFLPTRYRPD